MESPQRAGQAKPRAARAQASPRALRVELGSLVPGRALPFGAPAAAWVDGRELPGPYARVAGAGGAALALGLLARELGWPRTRTSEPALALGVAAGVVRGLPTAARASLHGFGALHGRYGEGQVGGELGARLGAACDALLLAGRAPARCGVLVLDVGRGELALHDVPALAGLDPAACLAALRARFGPCEALRVGAAAERGLCFANLAAGERRASYVGRGGLGARFAQLGLKALVVAGASAEAPAEHGASAALRQLLTRSPRLLARAAGGTLELYDAYAARGEPELSAELGARLGAEARERARERHGCRGCPTPCGWEFERQGGDAQRAHFGAALALGPALGLDGFAEQLELLAACDRAGLDARESGALLALQCEREPGLRTDAARLVARIERWVAAPDTDPPERGGAVAYARAHGLEHRLTAAQGQSARRELAPAAELGQHVSAGGSDPLRSFPFLATPDADAARLRELLAPLPLCAGSDDPLDPRGKGRLVWWHENASAAFDLAGFCAFSGAALLADGLCTLDELARAVAPEPVLARAPDEPGRAWLAAGADLALLRRALDPAPSAVPAALRLPGLLAEYQGCRGWSDAAGVDERALAAVGTLRNAEPWCALDAQQASSPAQPAASHAQLASSSAPASLPEGLSEPLPLARGTLHVRCAGLSAPELAAAHELELPCSVERALARLSLCSERARAWLLDERGHARVAVFRAGGRLAPEAEVRDGDVLDLVAVIGGG